MPLMPVEISFFGGKKLGCKTSAICFFTILFDVFVSILLLDIGSFTPFLFPQKLGGWGWGWERGKGRGGSLLLPWKIVMEERGWLLSEGKHVSTSPVKQHDYCFSFRGVVSSDVCFSAFVFTFGVSDCFMEVYSGELVAQPSCFYVDMLEVVECEVFFSFKRYGLKF